MTAQQCLDSCGLRVIHHAMLLGMNHKLDGLLDELKQFKAEGDVDAISDVDSDIEVVADLIAAIERHYRETWGE